MNAHSANSQFSFQLPSMSYIDAKWEEPELRAAPASQPSPRRRGVAGWIRGHVAAFKAWRAQRQAIAELQTMTDRELLDIGLTRADVGRVFVEAQNEDLRLRGLRG
jgi:uncharacterized protein YjiS (DUF1127 family)